MKVTKRIFILVFLFVLPWIWRPIVNMIYAQSTNPVTVTMVSPVAGSKVSGVIKLQANASSLAGPITRVEFYCDGKLIGCVDSNNVPMLLPPNNLNLRKL